MTYALAKALKDAGFPQHHWHIGLSSTPLEYETIRGEGPYIPTLSELIEACGKGFSSLHAPNIKQIGRERWQAIGHLEGWLNLEMGDTPEEVVARLWLALQDSKPYNEKSEM